MTSLDALWSSGERGKPWILTVDVEPGARVHAAVCEVIVDAARRSSTWSVLSAAELEILSAIDVPRARYEYATSRWLARVLLARLLDAEPTSVYLDAPRRGRPRTTPPAAVSMSHSDGLVAVAATLDGRVGVDVESVGAHLPALCRRFVPPYTSPPDPGAAGMAWVRWEAAAKLGRPATAGSSRLIAAPDGRTFGLAVAFAR